MRMSIKVALLERGFSFGVEMTKPEKRGEDISYIISSGEVYKKKVTTFASELDSDEFTFDSTKKKVKHNKTNQYFTLNEFVAILVENHLSDRLFWKRQVNRLADLAIKMVFWLSDKHYERAQVIVDRFHFKQGKKQVVKDDKSIEPFFKYFRISKNLFLSVLVTVFVLSLKLPHLLPGELSLSNPLVILLFFIALFSSEKLSNWLDEGIKEFMMPENIPLPERNENFIERLHNFQHQNKFDLKLGKRSKQRR